MKVPTFAYILHQLYFIKCQSILKCRILGSIIILKDYYIRLFKQIYTYDCFLKYRPSSQNICSKISKRHQLCTRRIFSLTYEDQIITTLTSFESQVDQPIDKLLLAMWSVLPKFRTPFSIQHGRDKLYLIPKMMIYIPEYLKMYIIIWVSF